MRSILKRIDMVCPECHSRLRTEDAHLLCGKCGSSYPISDGIPLFFRDNAERTADSLFQKDRMFDRTITAKLYNFGSRLISSEYLKKDHLAEFIRSIGPESRVAELGSGNRRLPGPIINIDIFPFPNVDIVADIGKTPFPDSSFDYLVLDTVLEHVPDPVHVVNEAFRILKTGGEILCIAPFLFPYHGYPRHYCNFSQDALEHLFRRYSYCRIETSCGPTSGIINILSEYIALALSGRGKFGYSFWKGVALLPIFWLKYLDRFWDVAGNGRRIASTLCVHAKK